MPTLVYTETTCDRCGVVERVEGARGGQVPDNWAIYSMYWYKRAKRGPGQDMMTSKHTLCSRCAAEVHHAYEKKPGEDEVIRGD